MPGLLITGDAVLTMDKNRRVIKDGAVYVEGNAIVAVGDAIELKQKFKPERVMGGRRKLVMPGFVNAHDHYVVGLLRQIADDRNLFGIIDDVWNLQLIKTFDTADVYFSARMGMAEQIKSGITTSFDDTVTWLPARMSKELVVNEIARAASDTGGGPRVVDTVGGFDREEGLGLAADLFLSDVQDTKRDCLNLIRRYNSPNSTFRIWSTASWPLGCTEENFRVMKQIADDSNTFSFSHVAEVKSEVESIKEQTGMSEIEYLESVGFLDENVLFAHTVWVDDSDIARLAKTGTKVSHQPVCNQYLADGIAPVPSMIKAGVTVGLGIDDGGHMNEDFFGLMKSFCILHKGITQDPKAATAEKALEMGTIDGARALGMSDSIGSLEVGKKADIIVVDIKGWNHAPRVRPITSLVYGGLASDVETTIVDGKVLMEDRKLRCVDEDSLMNKVERAAFDLIERADLRNLATESHLGWSIPYFKPEN
ncbi:MAG TPA: amidohydrolase [Nitrososphaerales archaeon]|nr:amidohydrolase [Nitrososphaerales archaeon]